MTDSAPASRPAPGAPARFAALGDVEPLSGGDGVALRVVSGTDVMLSHVTLEPNAVAAVHVHEEEQMGLVIAGSIRFSLDGVERELGPHDVFVAPPWVPHGGVAGPDGCTIVDLFSPPRAAFVAQLAEREARA
ncbi:cupin domain-containing protein [Agromyces atrinae]|uniref:cupin domain-containing protein n=1 Tax=Agromyces atrinae TaxID=592376 RepID=UPI001F55FE7A|nr:cupin domain-containing protein [Agromyces atrinae]MCI2957349.1 cupin domain-containing protein [Agromyces atrinae]